MLMFPLARPPGRHYADATLRRGQWRLSHHLRAAAAATSGGGAPDVFDAVPALDDRMRCSALLRERAVGGDHYGCTSLLRWMLARGLRPNRLALAAAVKSSSALPDCRGGAALGRCLHGLAVKVGYADGAVVAKAVMDMYGRIGSLADAHTVFDEMSCSDADNKWRHLLTTVNRLECLCQLKKRLVPGDALFFLRGTADAAQTSEASKASSSSRTSDLPPSTPWFRELWVNADK